MRSASPPRPVAVSALLVLFIAACGGGSDGPATPARPTVASVTVAMTNTLDAGSTTQATAVALDASSQPIAGRTVSWSSSPTSVATVDAASGVVTGQAPGSATITATVDGRTGSAALTVRAAAAVVGATVTMLPQSFLPPFVTVRAGQAVAFDFSGNVDHNVIFRRPLTGVPQDILPRRSGVVTRVFPSAGVFPFECTLHNGMTGEVTVTP